MRALIVDDAAIRDMLSMVLEFEGFETELASDGTSGLATARARTPDVIVLDVMMPDMDGWSVAEILREDEELRDVPIVFCTAMAGEDQTWRGWKLGAASYVCKPFDNSQLVTEVLRAMQPRVAAAA
ncbi:MAG TPA: response regulator [Nitriliruptorales bacterium]